MSEDILEKQLFEIIRNKDLSEDIKLAKIDMLIRLGVDVNATYGARSVLNLAKYKKEEKIVKFLEENGARDFIDEKKANKLGVELCEICEREAKGINIAEIKELIDMGADVSAEDTKGNTALMCASVVGHKEIAELLIQNGANVNQKDINGATALMEASYWGNKEVVELLIQNRADVNQKNNNGNTALIYATLEGYKEIVELLIQSGANVNQKNNDGETALMEALSKGGYKEIVEFLIQNGADVDQKNNDGRTALMEASRKGRNEIVELLIQNGADVNQKDNNGETAKTLAKDKKTRKAIINAVKKKNIKENGGSFFSKIKKGLEVDR